MRTSEEAQNETWRDRMIWLRRWLVVCCLALLAATWRLWTPQTVFPQVPFLSALRTAPTWLDWLGLSALSLALVALLALSFLHRRRPASAGREGAFAAAPAPRTPAPSPEGEGCRWCPWLRAFALLFAASLALLVLLDQHRFQPWGYQFGIVAIVLAFAPAGRGASLLRVLTIGIYFWSAVSKVDNSFLHSTGPDLLRSLFGVVGIDPRGINRLPLTSLAWLLPLSELTVAVLLTIRRTRTFGLGLAISMHVALMLALGPLGLKSAAGVLLWNLYFIGQDLLLFWKPTTGWHGAAGAADGRLRLRGWSREAVPAVRTIGIEHIAVALAIWLPILEPFGLLDHWPAWAVYAPGGERVTLLVDRAGAERLPEPLRRFLGKADFAGRQVFRTDLWSLDALNAPIYPQGRFRTGVAFAVVERYGIGDAATLVVESRADRRTGERTRRTVVGADGIREYAGSFRLNALPREPWGK